MNSNIMIVPVHYSPDGSIDGVNTEFTIKSYPIDDVSAFIDGRQVDCEVTGVSVVISPAPPIGSEVTVSYLEEVTVD